MRSRRFLWGTLLFIEYVRDLKSAEMEDIVVTCEYIPDVFGFECKFTLPSNGKTYIVDAEDPFPERSFK